MKLYSTLILSFIATNAAFGADTTDIFPDRMVMPDRMQIAVTVDNPGNQAIFCDYINSFVAYRSSVTDNNLDELLALRRVAIPNNWLRTMLVGMEKTKALRQPDLYPDAKIDVVRNDLLSQSTRCYYQVLTADDRAAIARTITFDEIRNVLNAGYQKVLSTGSRYPTLYRLSTVDRDIVLTIESTLPGDRVKSGFRIYSNGAFDWKSALASEYDKVGFDFFAAGSSSGRDKLEDLIQQLPGTENYYPPDYPSNVMMRDSLVAILKAFITSTPVMRPTIKAGSYMMKNQATGKCVNLKVTQLGADGYTDGDIIHQWDCPPPGNEWTNNYWRFESVSEGKFKLVSEYSSQCLLRVVHNGSNPFAAQGDCSKAGAQGIFTFEQSGDGMAIREVNSNQCLSLRSDSNFSSNGTSYVFESCDEQAHGVHKLLPAH